MFGFNSGCNRLAIKPLIRAAKIVNRYCYLQTLSIRNVKFSDADKGCPLRHKLPNSSDDSDLEVKASANPLCVGKAYTIRYKSV